MLPCSTMPFRIAPIACSRMPKCSTRPYGLPVHSWVECSSGMKDATPSMVVLFDSARSAEPPQSSGMTGAEGAQHLAARGAGRQVLARLEDRERRLDAVGQGAGQDAVEQRLAVRVRRAQASKSVLPGGVRLGAAVDRLAGVLDDVVGDDEGLAGSKPEHLLDGGELVGAERRSVDLAGVLLLRRRPADDRLQDDERRLVEVSACAASIAALQLGDVLDVLAGLLPVDRLHVPAVRLVAGLATSSVKATLVSSSIEIWLLS